MASKETPKKLYKKRSESTGDISRCRLCNCVTDPGHSKNLFRANNQVTLQHAKLIYGGELPHSSSLPHLICKPCERRLNNAVQFKKLIADTQLALQENIRTKRCVDVSPSVAKPSSKLRASGSTRRRSIDFGGQAQGDNPTPDQGDPVLVDTAGVVFQANKELLEVARRSDSSVLRQREYDGLAAEGWISEILNELETRCPIVSSILCGLCENTISPEKKNPAICLIYGIMMFLRCHELSRLQRINSVLLVHGQASVNLIAQLNKYGICLEPTRKYQILDDIGNHFLDRAAELVKAGHKFAYVLDNIDWEEKVHDLRKDVQNRSVHAVATSIVFNRVSDKALPDSGPQQDLRMCNIDELVRLSDVDMETVRSRYKIFIARLLFKHFTAFDIFKQYALQENKCLHAAEMTTKSEVITMPILMKDEKKYSEVVDVLDQLEKWTEEIYSAAGLCSSNTTSSDATPTIEGTSRPDQPASHFPATPSDNDPLSGIKIPCFGDQLTRVRFAGAKDLRAGCHSASQRFDHLYPFCIVDWHTKRSYLKTVFKKLYKNSGREKGTLRYFREKLNRRKVTVDVKHYEDCEQLFCSVGKCFVIEALLEFFQMDDAKHKPTANGPHSVNVFNEDYRKQYISTTLDKFIDEYVLINEEESEAESEEESSSSMTDGVWCYGINLLKSYLLLADIKDAVATGNGEYLAIIRKQLLVHFFSTPGFNEFSIEMLINILQCQVLLSESEAHRCKWAATVNWKGGAGNNIEIDLFQENRNNEMKKLIKSMGANKTHKAIIRASKASGGVAKVVEAFEDQVSMPRRSSTHTHKSSTDDESLILRDLRSLRPFEKKESRAFESFAGISYDPTHSFDNDNFQQWVNRHKKNILLHYPMLDNTELPEETS